ncbi:MAG TPA: hypothetical protein PLU71_01490 [Candidatus Dependentiae bacterium]|nr:hypothetical protein [Candidatus Dependentiae bacterium]HRQ62505.1 hypothetical protein [Candidatus Dependentiae bacterium]
MMKSPIIHIIVDAAWIITGLAALNIGLMPFGFDIFSTNFLMFNYPQLSVILRYLIGISGIISLAAFFLSIGKHGNCSCNCCG